MSAFRFLEPARDYRASGGTRPGWSRRVDVDGKLFIVGVEGLRQIRIPYRPRGSNTGWQWSGFVRDEKGREVWSGRVGGSLGARGLLRAAGLIAEEAK